jgi:hypothetical protein
MGDKPASAKQPDPTPILLILLTLIVAGLGSIRSCEPYTGGSRPPAGGNKGGGGFGGGCAQPQPSLTQGSKKLNQITILAGSYESKAQANALAAQLRAMRISNFTVRHEGKWHVCVGRYWSIDRANRMAEVLKGLGVSNPVVLSPKGK